MITANLNPFANTLVYNNHPTAVDNFVDWHIVNSDKSALSAGAAFNVTVVADRTSYLHVSNASNTKQNTSFTTLDHPLANDNPNAIIHVTPVNYVTPPSSPFHVAYGLIPNRWSISNTDGSDMPLKIIFKVTIYPAGGGHFVHTTTAGTSVDNYTIMNHQWLEGNRAAIIQVTPRANGGAAIERHLGVQYLPRSGKWAITAQDATYAMPADLSFNVSIFLPNQASAVTQVFGVTGGSPSVRHSIFWYNTPTCSPILTANSHSPSIGEASKILFHTGAKAPFVSDANADTDVFLSHGSADTTAISTVAGALTTGNAASSAAVISADGEFVAYATAASDLPAGDTNGFSDIVLRSVSNPTKDPIRISVTSSDELATGGGSYAPAISRFGNHIAFESDATNLMSADNGVRHIYVHDREVLSGCVLLISLNQAGEPGNDSSHHASISANGRYVAFESFATNLVEGDTNGVSDIFVFDRDADGDLSFYQDAVNCIPGPSRIFRVSIASDGAQANSASSKPDISANGDFVAFVSSATNLVLDDTNGIDDIFVHYRGFTDTIKFARDLEQIYLPLIRVEGPVE